MKLKVCSSCREAKPATSENFVGDKGSPDGFFYYCKPCAKKRYNQRSLKKMNMGKYPIGYIICTECGVKKLATTDNFYISSNLHKGLIGCCIPCTVEKQSVNRQTRKGRSKIAEYNRRKQGENIRRNESRDPYETDGEKHCPDCGVTKSVTEFHRNRTRPDGLKNICKPCAKYRSSKFREDNPERAKEIQAKASRKWQINNPDSRKKYRDLDNHRRRAREKQLPETFTIEQWEYALSYFNGCCAVCERQMNDMFGEFTASQDHWIPISYEGDDNPGHVAENIVPLCHGVDGCNNRKHNKLPEDWLTETYGKRKAKAILARIEAYFEHVKERNVAA